MQVVAVFKLDNAKASPVSATRSVAVSKPKLAAALRKPSPAPRTAAPVVAAGAAPAVAIAIASGADEWEAF